MKKSHILSAVVVLSLLASTAPASALSLGATINGNASVSSDDGYQAGSSANTSANATAAANWKSDDNGRDDNASVRGMMDGRLNAAMNHWKMWDFNGGIMGTVTATSSNSITVKASNGTTYTVDTTNADIRTSNSASIATGDKVYIQGVTSGSSIVATLVIDGKATTPTPTTEDKRMAIAGTVTAKSGTSLTVVSRNGKTYTVSTSGSTAIWMGKDKSAALSDISIGDAVVVQGSVSGSSATAAKIYAVHFPETSANGGIRGTVTAINDGTLTLMVAGGTTYSVNTADATFKDRKNDVEQLSDVHVGDMVTVNGTVSGSTISADTVSEAKVHEGFFASIGNFFRHLFGRKSATVNSSMNATVDGN